MELRGCSHFHFISLIRGGEVIKVPNISRERKVLKLKNVLEILVSNEFPEKSPPKVDRFLDTSYGCEKVDTKVKIEHPEEESELDLCSMTLKQLQDTCKSKKRKKLRSISTAVKQECDELQLQEDETELKETLGSWKRKLFKKRKVKRNSRTNCAAISSETDILRERSEEIPSDLALHTSSKEIFRPLRIKVENVELGYSQPQPISVILGDDLENMTSDILEDTGLCCSKEIMEMASEDLQSGCLSGTSSNLLEQQISIPLETQTCMLNLVSYEYEEIKLMSPNRELNEHLQHIQLKTPLISEDSEFENIAHLGDMAVPGDHCPVLPVSELRNIENMTDLTTLDEASQIMISECESFNALQVLPCQDKTVDVQHLGTGHSCHDVEIIDNNKSNWSIDGYKNPEAEVIRSVGDCSSIETSETCLPSTNDVAPSDALTCATDDKELLMLDDSVDSLTCSPNVRPNEIIDEVPESAISESYHDKEVVIPPERLFSARKTISPSSQQRLCKALNSVDLQCYTDVNYCKEKLVFEKDCEDRSSSSWSDVKRDQSILKAPEASNSAVIMANRRQSTRKGKDEKKGLRVKGIVKGPYSPHMSQRAASNCTSVQNCSRNATKFSQQQMHDIERLATKLVTELQSMKEIVIDGMHCESRAGAKSRYSTDEIRVAVENATKAEETTRKWLSIMTRDCNRFCKIMTLAEANDASPEAPSPEKNGQKERKKIVFADEAGGSLCHVRVFETLEAGMDIASPVKSPVVEERLGA